MARKDIQPSAEIDASREAKMEMDEGGSDLAVSHYEGSVLALALRNQPVTAYQLLKLFEGSPLSSLNKSKGNFYPLIRRMKHRGLLVLASNDGGRGPERLVCSDEGVEAARHWLKNVRETDILLDDPLRTRSVALGLLTKSEQREWIRDVQAMIARKIEEVEAYNLAVDIPFQEMVFDNVMRALTGRMIWLQRLSKYIEESTEARSEP